VKISSFQLKEERYGVKKTPLLNNLGNIVILAGSNGSGKTRLLKMFEEYFSKLRDGNDEQYFDIKIIDNSGKAIKLTTENIKEIEIANYSHYDAQLQSPKNFTPYVIQKSKAILKHCSYEETALNALLFLQDLANGYSREFADGKKFSRFVKEAQEIFGLKISVKNNKLQLFDNNIEDVRLSPGQQYLLRMAVACYCNQENDKLVFFLDEPELHLHPKALIDLIIKLRKKFAGAQFWISTHALSLISYFVVSEDSTTVIHLKDGNANLFRSNSEELLDGLIGAEENRLAIAQLMRSPDDFACVKFAVECFNPDETVEIKKNDPQVEISGMILQEGDVTVDFGAGRGRLLCGFADTSVLEKNISYYAYDPSSKDAEKCKAVMEQYGFGDSYYFNSSDDLVKKLHSKVNYVFLVNVLHEIDPSDWENAFSIINSLLNDNGKLIIVERQELTIGESPYQNGFLMITKNSAKVLFNDKCNYTEHSEKKYIVRHIVDKQGLEEIGNRVKLCVEYLKSEALNKIRILKKEKKKLLKPKYAKNKFKTGIKLAFWLHQYANASLILESG